MPNVFGFGTRSYDEFPAIAAIRTLLGDDLVIIWPRREEIVEAASNATQLDAHLVGRVRLAIDYCHTLLDMYEESSVRWGLTDWITEVEALTDVLDDLYALLHVPAFAGTGGTLEDFSASPVRSETVFEGDTLERVARRVTGNAEDWDQINVDPWDEFDAGWIGRILQVPTQPNQELARRSAPPGVWDGAVGANALGRDLDRTLSVDGTTNDLTLLTPAATLFQGLQNILDTPKGAIDTNPHFGSHVESIIGESWGDMTPQVMGIEIKKALLADARVESIAHVLIEGESDFREITVEFTTIVGNAEQLRIGLV